MPALPLLLLPRQVCHLNQPVVQQ